MTFRITLPIEIGSQTISADCLMRYHPGNLNTPVYMLDEPPCGPSFVLERCRVGDEDAPRWLYTAIQADLDDGGYFFDQCSDEVYEGV